MNETLKLYKYVNGSEDTPFPSADRQVELTSFDYSAKRMGGAPVISATFLFDECLDNEWADNVYVVFNGERYLLKQTPTSSYDNTNCRYKHEVEFVSERIVLDNVYFYDVVSDDVYNDKYASNSSKVVFSGDIHEFASRLKYSLKYANIDYTVVVDDDVQSEVKHLAFEDQFFSGVLQEIYNTYNLPYYFNGKTIHIGYSLNTITRTFKYGVDDALISIQKQNANYKVVNRVTGVGSEDNIPYYYPNKYESKDEVEASGETWIQPQGKLMPPIYRESLGAERFYNAENNTYINPNTGEYYIFENPFVSGKQKEHIVSFEDIKPTIKGITNASGLRIDMFSDFAYDHNDNDDVDEEGNFLHPYFFGKLRKFDGDFGFNLFDQVIDEGEMCISMTSGSCGACEFIIGVDESSQKNTVQVNSDGTLKRDTDGNVVFGTPQDSQNDTINNEVWVALRKDIDTFGVIMPNANSNYKPSTSDTFVILHIDLPYAYIAAAEENLKEQIIAYMAMNNSEKFNFSIKFSRIFFAENQDILSELDENSLLQIEYNGARYELYVSSFSYRQTSNEPLPEITVELSDTLTIAQNAIQIAINEIKQDLIGNAANVDWMKYGLRYFLRKDISDRTRGILASDKAFEVGNYVKGMIGGSGARLYKDDNNKTILEVDKIHGREELLVPTITFNNTEVISGDKANTFAYGTIKEVDTEACFATLDLLEDEFGTLKEYDILRGVFHNINGGNNTETKVDGNGFLQYSGFFTSYFTPRQIVKDEAGTMTFFYDLQDGTSMHPCPGMKFFAYGNFVYPERQSITYETREYKRRLVKMATWDIVPSTNIAMQDGNLDGLEIGGFKMQGYGTFQTNSYFTGTTIQFTPDQLSELKGEDAYSVSLSTYEGVIKVDVEGNVTSGMTSAFNVVTNGMNVTTDGQNVVTTDFSLKTSIQASRGNTTLYYSTEIGDGSYIATLNPVGCNAYILNGNVIVTDITDLSNCYITIVVNCEGRHLTEKVFRINAIKDGEKSGIETIYSTLEKPSTPENVHPYEDNEEWSHTYTSDDIWMAVSTSQNDKWSDWVLTRLKGFEFKVLPETTTIGRTLIGDLNPKTLRLTCYKVYSGNYIETTALWNVYRYDGTTWELTDYYSESAYIDFTFANDEYKAYKFVATPVGYEDVSIESSVTIVDDGKAGQIARYRGVYKEGETYVWDEEYRDIVIYNSNAWQVKSFGASFVATSTFDESLWNEANKFDFVAMNTALIDNANIAGFTFTVTEYRDGIPYGTLSSSDGRIKLDAANGKLSCVDADVNGNIDVETMTHGFQYVNTTSLLTPITKSMVFAIEGASCLLPSIESGKSRTVQIYSPYGEIIIKASSYNSSTGKMDYLWMNGTVENTIRLVKGNMYTFTSLPMTFSTLEEEELGGAMVWVVTRPLYSGATSDVKVEVDEEVIQGSENPVSGGAVYDYIEEKVKGAVQFIESESEATNPDTLYVVV